MVLYAKLKYLGRVSKKNNADVQYTSWQKIRALYGISTITAWAWQNIPVPYLYGFSGK